MTTELGKTPNGATPLGSEELLIDPARSATTQRETGIAVRAKFPNGGKWFSTDIVYLDRESLRTWLKSRGGDNPWAENTVMHLLGHD